MVSSTRYRRWTIASLGLAAILVASPVIARSAGHAHADRSHAQVGRSHARIILSGMVYRSSGSSLQCVPFARENSGIELAGNAANWWDAATGIYERGARPEVGSVLNFRANGRMRMGHVAVVSNVLDSRNVEIDHANWSGRGSVRRNVRVIDVSASNDWSAVRVALGQGDYGSVYPTYGFIYDRPDKGTMVANNSSNAAMGQAIRLNTAPMMAAARDLRAPAERVQLAPVEEQEVAEAPEEAVGHYRRHVRGGSRPHESRPTRVVHGHTAVVTVSHRTRTAAATPAIAKHHRRA